ncbi:MAG: hypothetical protein C4344_01640, partial [Acidimicrobiia bacterium]
VGSPPVAGRRQRADNATETFRVRCSQTGRDVAPEPLCPECGGPMVLRTARRGRRAGNSFWGCANFPVCRGTRDVDNQDIGNVDGPQLSPSTARGSAPWKRTEWVDATLDRPGWFARYIPAGGRLRSARCPTELEWVTRTAWIAHDNRATAGRSGDATLRVVAAVRKIVQRGDNPFMDPWAERQLLELIGLGGAVRDSPLPGDLSPELQVSAPQGAVEPLRGLRADLEWDLDIPLDSDEEKGLITWLTRQVGPSVLWWVTPQASLDLL